MTKLSAEADSPNSEYASAARMSHTSSLPKPSPWTVRGVLSQLPPTDPAPAEFSSTPVPFFHFLHRLKLEKREGWRRFGINQGESIADHMYRMSLITMFAPPAIADKIDIHRCTKMALVHDMAEGLVGDLTPVDGVPKPEKSRRETETMDWVATNLLGKVNGGIVGKDLREIWQEYEDGQTFNSKFVHDVDKIELILQMVEYERGADCRIDLSEFSRVAKRLSLNEMKAWAQEILEEREKLWEDHHKQPRMDPEQAETIQEAHDAYYGKMEDGTVNGVASSTTNGSSMGEVGENCVEQPQ